MKRHIPVDSDVVRTILKQLGYTEVRGNHFKKGHKLHIILHTHDPNQTYLSMHVDYPRAPWCPSRHIGVDEDSRLVDEFRKIKALLTPRT